MNAGFLANDISLVIIGLKKTGHDPVRKLAGKILNGGYISNVRFLLFTDDTVDVEALHQVAWIAANNIDPGVIAFLRSPARESGSACFVSMQQQKPQVLMTFIANGPMSSSWMTRPSAQLMINGTNWDSADSFCPFTLL